MSETERPAAERERPEAVLADPLAGRTVSLPDAPFVIAEWKDQGGRAEEPQLIAPLHVHNRDEEAWYVLEGVLRFRLGGREVEAPAGAAVFAPRGVPHTFWNPGPGPARYLVVMTPNTARMLEDLHSLADSGPEAVRAVFRKYDCDLLT